MNDIKISIDGPSGAGKTTISKIVAKEMNFIHLDTGSMYRALAYYAYNNNLPLNENIEKELLPAINDLKIVFLPEQKVFLVKEDITEKIRTTTISNVASFISGFKNIREKLVNLQRKLVKEKNVIIDGRDIASTVFPSADVKIFLTASLLERAKRRYEEYKDKKIPCILENVEIEIKKRDENDMTRKNSPLEIASGSIILDTTGNTLSESVFLVKDTIKKWLNI